MAGEQGKGTKDGPWMLKTPSGESEFTAYRDESLTPPAIVVNVGKTELRYHLRCLDDLQTMLRSYGDWMPLGNADEQKPAEEGTVEAWAPVRGEPDGRMVRSEKRAAGPFRHLHPADHGESRDGRGRAQPQE